MVSVKTLNPKNISGKGFRVILLPLALFIFVVIMAFLLGGVTFVFQGLRVYFYGFIAGIPFLFFGRDKLQGAIKRVSGRKK